MTTNRTDLLIGIVGPCASGKTTLISALKLDGFSVRHIAQEHSYVLNMWERMTNPDVLIFLDASYDVTQKRRNLNWTREEYQQQQIRLVHAREHANLYIQTDELSPAEVYRAVVSYLQDHLPGPADPP